MSKRYPGNFITGNPVALSQTSNNGIWDLKDQYQAHTNGTWQEVDGVYEIPRSLRFRTAASTYLSRTPTTAGNRRKFTWSGWVKRTTTARSGLFGFGTSASGGSSGGACYIDSGTINFVAGGGVSAFVQGTPRLRDPSAWYHIVIAVDTTQAVNTNRVKMYVNGVQITDFSTTTWPSQDFDTDYNNTIAQYLGIRGDGGLDSVLDGYMAEVYSVDGQQLDASYFGYFDPITGIWQPKKYTGAYGVNGFYLNFSDNSHATQTLGRNFGVGSNYTAYSETCASWQTLNNVSVTSNTHIAPDGNTTADTVTMTSASAGSYIYHGNSVSVSTPFTASMWFKAGTVNYVTMSEGHTSGAYASFSLTGNGYVTGSGSGATNANITPAGNGWYRCSFTYVTGGAQSTWGFRFEPRSTYGGAGSVGDSVIAWGAQLNFGVTIGPYNPSTSSFPTNDWAAYNFSITAGATYDSMVDSPTNVFTSATDIGGVVPGNYPTIDPLEPIQSYITYSNGNLSYAQSAAVGFGPQAMTKATFQLPKTGKWVWAITIGSTGNNSQMGIARPDYVGNPTRAQYGAAIVTTDYAVMNPTGGVVKNGTEISTSSSIGVGDELQCAVDCDIGTVSWYRNGTYLGQATSMPTTTNDYWPMTFGASSGSSGSGSYNFGQRPFAYAPPAGFKTLNTTNLQALGTAIVGKAAIQANKWMEATVYGGTAIANNRIINTGQFAPDLVWLKRTGSSGNHHVSDSVRGAGRVVYPNLTNIEAADPGVVAFNSDGFTVSGNGNEVSRQIAWQWKQSPTSGFNIISYTGTGVARGISHNLGVAPRFMIVKQRDVAVRSWAVYHAGLTNPQSAFYLDSVAAPFAYTGFFNNQAPDANNIYLGTDATVNQSGSAYTAYVWSEVPGFSKFGSYMGTNSSDGPIVYTGFKPKWILIRESALSSGNSRDWLIWDSSRTPYNGYSTSDTSGGAQSITSSAPYTGSSGYSDAIDFLSNGFKFKNAGSPNYNNASSFVYAAFAESPFALNNRAT